ncbi:MAG: hypothetical protein AAGD06_11055 [Acidobacteriota bacterium]
MTSTPRDRDALASTAGEHPASGSPPGELRGQPETRAWLWLGLLAGAALIAARAPVLLWDPRLWAEEATVYLAYARDHGVWRSLFLVPTTSGPAGYLNLAANLPAVLATRLVPLWAAPWITTAAAFAVQLTPLWILLGGRSRLGVARDQRVVACLVMVLAPPLVSEVWLNTINSQVFLAVAALLILAEDVGSVSRRRFAGYVAIVTLGALSGPYTCFLAPFFLWRAFVAEPGPRTRLLALLATATAGLQAAVFFWTDLVLGLSLDRFTGGGMGPRLARIVHLDVVQALLGEDLAVGLARVLGLLPAVGPRADALGQPYLRLAGWVSAVALVGLVLWLWRSLPARTRWLPFAFVWLAGTVALAAGPALPARRYAVVPGLALLLSLVAGAWSHRPVPRWACRLLLGFALMVGTGSYFEEVPSSSLGRTEGSLVERPSWRHEVARWRTDPDRPLAIWPYGAGNQGWRVHLPPAGTPRPQVTAAREPLRLVSSGEWVERSYSIPGLDGDFKMVMRFLPSRGSEDCQFRLRLLDDEGATLALLGPGAFAAERTRRWVLERGDRRLDGVPLERARRVAFAIRSEVATPARVLIQDLYVGPRVEGALEPLLPQGTTPAAFAFRAANGGRALGGLGLVALALLAAMIHRAGRASGTAESPPWAPTVFLLASILPALALSGGWEVLGAAALFWPVTAWIHRGSRALPPGTSGAWTGGLWGALLALPPALAWSTDSAVAAPALAAPLVLIAGAVAKDRRAIPLVAIAAGALAAAAAVRGLAPWATPWARGTMDLELGIWQRAWASILDPRTGWLGLFPGALVAVALFAVGRDEPRRFALFVTLCGACGWLVAAPTLGAGALPLGPGTAAASTMAVLFPLFWLLVAPWPRRGWPWWILVAVTLIWTLPAASESTSGQGAQDSVEQGSVGQSSVGQGPTAPRPLEALEIDPPSADGSEPR